MYRYISSSLIDLSGLHHSQLCKEMLTLDTLLNDMVAILGFFRWCFFGFGKIGSKNGEKSNVLFQR